MWRGILQPRWQWHLFGLSMGHLLLRQRRSCLHALSSRGSFLCAGQCGTRGVHVPVRPCVQCQRTSGEVPSEHVQSRRGWRVHPLPTVHSQWPRRGCLPTNMPDIHWRRDGVSASGVYSFFVRSTRPIPVGDMAVEVLSLQCAEPGSIRRTLQHSPLCRQQGWSWWPCKCTLPCTSMHLQHVM